MLKHLQESFGGLHVRCVAWYKLLKQTSFVCMSESRVYPQNLNNRSYIYTHAGDLPQWRALCLVRTSSQSIHKTCRAL